MSNEIPGGAAGIKVLVIDDSNTIRRSAEMFLRQAGFEVILAEDGFDALAKINDDGSAASDTSEIQPSQLAGQKAENTAVRDFAQRMINDHGMLSDSLRAMAQANNITPAPNPLSQQVQSQTQTTLQRLQGLSGAEFDQAYMQAMVDSSDGDLARAVAARSPLPTISPPMRPWATRRSARRHAAVPGRNACAARARGGPAGVIGQVASLLGRVQLNIAEYRLGRDEPGGTEVDGLPHDRERQRQHRHRTPSRC